MKNKKIALITEAAAVAAVYVILTFVANALGLASGVIQIRISEALTILPWFTFSAVPGLFVGCILANMLTGCALFDVIFGSLATLLGALGNYYIGVKRPGGEKAKWLLPLPPILANTLIVPFVLAYVYQFEGSIPYFMLTVGIGEVISCGVLGLVLFSILKKNENSIFQRQ
ncbi:MAG: QueT transporter family protein [Lachnospiraceae bacterium]|nr:QueT transporter family protein [Lachnospiraceae bacterium]